MHYSGQFSAADPLIGGATLGRNYDSRKSNPTQFDDLFRGAYNSFGQPQPNRGGPVQPPPAIRIMCPQHSRFIVQVCMHTNCRDRLLCQRCVNEHTSSHVACFESPDEIFSSTKIEALRNFIHFSDNKRLQAEDKHRDFLHVIDDIFREFYHMLEKYKADLKEYVIEYTFPNINPTMLVEIENAIMQFDALQKGIISSQSCSDSVIEEFIAKFHRLTYLHEKARQVLEYEKEIDYGVVATYVKQMLKDAQDAMKIHLHKLDFDNMFELSPQKGFDLSPSPIQKGFEVSRVYSGGGGGGGGGAGGWISDNNSSVSSIQAFEENDPSFLSNANSHLLPPKYPKKDVQPEMFHQSTFRVSKSPRLQGPIGNTCSNLSLKEELELKKPQIQLINQLDTGLRDTSQALVYIDENDHIAIGGKDVSEKSPLVYKISIWDLKTRKQVMSIPSHYKTINRLLYVPENKLMISASLDSDIKVWRCGDKYSFERTLHHEDELGGIEYVPKEKMLVACGDFKDIQCYEIENEYQKKSMSTAGVAGFNCLKYYEERDILMAACASKGQMWIYDWPTKTLLQKVEANPKGLSMGAVAFYHGNQFILPGKEGNLLQVWHFDKENKAVLEKGDINAGQVVSALLPMEKGRFLLGAVPTGTIKIWTSSNFSLCCEYHQIQEKEMELGSLVAINNQREFVASDVRSGTIFLFKFSLN